MLLDEKDEEEQLEEWELDEEKLLLLDDKLCDELLSLEDDRLVEAEEDERLLLEEEELVLSLLADEDDRLAEAEEDDKLWLDEEEMPLLEEELELGASDQYNRGGSDLALAPRNHGCAGNWLPVPS